MVNDFGVCDFGGCFLVFRLFQVSFGFVVCEWWLAGALGWACCLDCYIDSGFGVLEFVFVVYWLLV